MAKVLVSDQYLTDIANAIRNKKSVNNTYTPAEMAAAITSIPTGGSSTPNLQAKTASPTLSQQVIAPDNGYDGLSRVTISAMPTAEHTQPSISLNTSNGLITASHNQVAGYVAAGTTSDTLQLTTKAAATYTPTTTNQTIASGQYLIGVQTIQGDSNLIASNIKHDTSIFGVTGTFKIRIESITMTTSARDTSITFTGLKAEPLAFFYDTMGDITMNRSYRNLTSVSYDGNIVRSCTYYLSGGNSGYGRYFTTCSYTYSNGSLTITSAGTGTSGYFYNGQHILIYIYEE